MGRLRHDVRSAGSALTNASGLPLGLSTSTVTRAPVRSRSVMAFPVVMAVLAKPVVGHRLDKDRFVLNGAWHAAVGALVLAIVAPDALLQGDQSAYPLHRPNLR